MNKHPVLLRWCLAFVLSAAFGATGGLAQGAKPEAAPPVGALLVSMTGKIQIRQGQAAQMSATAGMPLRVGDRLTCEGAAASFILLTSEGRQQQVAGKACAAEEGYRIAYDTGTGKYAAALERYGRTGGRPRGAIPGLLIWPHGDVRARVETAAQIEWRPQAQGSLTLTLRAADDNQVLWTQEFDATRGKFQSPELTAAMRRYSETASRKVVLQLRLTAAQSAEAAFTIVGGEDERRVQQQLNTLSALSGTAAAVLRADVFLEEGLSRDALEEYAAALITTPDAPFLLQKAAALATELSDPRAVDLTRRAKALNPL